MLLVILIMTKAIHNTGNMEKSLIQNLLQFFRGVNKSWTMAKLTSLK